MMTKECANGTGICDVMIYLKESDDLKTPFVK